MLHRAILSPPECGFRIPSPTIEARQGNQSLVDRRGCSLFNRLLMTLPIADVTRHHFGRVEGIPVVTHAPVDKMLQSTTVGGDRVSTFALLFHILNPS